MKNETNEQHPSYGMIEFSRTSGAGRLFGSPLSQHFGTVRVRISHGERTHDLGEDRYHAEKRIVEIELSASQFAETITTMNVANGVPCTLRWLQGIGSIENVPETEHSEMHRAKENFRSNISAIVANVKKRGKTIAEILKKDRLSKDDRTEIGSLVEYVMLEIDRNAPWFVEQFQEATDRVATKAKAEIVAMFEHAIRQTGLSHLATNAIVPALPKHNPTK